MDLRRSVMCVASKLDMRLVLFLVCDDPFFDSTYEGDCADLQDTLSAKVCV